MGFAQASGWAKVALIVVFIGAILDIAGFATNNWVVYEAADGSQKVYVGLWNLISCNTNACTTVALPDIYTNTIFNVMRIMETLGVILAVFLVFFILIYVCVDAMKTSRIVRTAMVLCFLTGIVIFVGMCLCLAYVNGVFVVGFSMGLTVLGYLLILIAGSLLIPDSCEPRDDDEDYGYDRDRDRDYDRDDRGRYTRRW